MTKKSPGSFTLHILYYFCETKESMFWVKQKELSDYEFARNIELCLLLKLDCIRLFFSLVHLLYSSKEIHHEGKLVASDIEHE